MLTTHRGWFQKLLGEHDEFFDLLEAGAQEARTSVRLLSEYLDSLGRGDAAPALAAVIESRRRQKLIRTRTVESLSKSFITPLEREDVQALAFALYRIPKLIEKIADRLSIYPGRVPYAAFKRQAEQLSIAADAVEFMVKQLRDGADIEKVKKANARLQAAEGEADKLMLELVKELYSGPYDAKEVIILRGLYEVTERAVDRCRNVGNIVVSIALKNS